MLDARGNNLRRDVVRSLALGGYAAALEIASGKLRDGLRSGALSVRAMVRRRPERSTKKNDRLLVIDQQLPQSGYDSGGERLLRILEWATASFEAVTMTSLYGSPPEAKARVEELGVRVVSRDTGRRQLDQELSRASAVLLARPHVASEYYPMVKSVNAEARIVYDTVDLHHVRARGEGEIAGSRQRMVQAWLLERLELAIFRAVDAVLVLTDEEERYVRGHVPGCPCVKVPMIHDIHRTSGPASRRGLLFVGNFGHQPNVDAMAWMTREVLPRLAAMRPLAELDIVGFGLPVEHQRALPDNANYLGRIDDLAPVYESHRVALAPMRFGAGMKGKVTQALSYGLPVVTTPVGAEGLPPSPAIHIADSASELVSEAVELLDSDDLWAESSSAALEVAAQVCNMEDAEASLRQAFNR